MSNVVLPSFIPVKFKPGFSGRIDQAEQMLISKKQYPVCIICKDGPRCTVTHQTKTGLALQDGSPCGAASTWTLDSASSDYGDSAWCKTVQRGDRLCSSP